MKFLTGCLLFIALCGFFSTAYAQGTGAAIQGKIVTADHSPAEASTIILLKLRDSSIVSSAITDKDGRFRFTLLPPSDYLLLVSAIGYNKLYKGPYHLVAGLNFTTPDIVLDASVKELKEVAVIGAKPDIQASAGKIILNVQNNLAAAGSSVFDFLRQSPGVRVDNGNNISIVGRQSALIMVDGKPTNLSGEDLAGLLKSMQANSIDYIELITNGSAKYDASGGGIVNIVMKKGKNNGANATVTGTVGFGRYYKGAAGIVFNDRTDKFNIFGTYTFNDYKTFHDFTADRIINYNNTLSDYDVNYNNTQKTVGHNLNAGIDYYLSKTQTIGFLVTGNIRTDNVIKDNNLRIANQGALDSTITSTSGLNRQVSNLNYNLNYTGKLNKAGATLSADVNYMDYSRSSEEHIINNFFDASGLFVRRDSLQNLSPSTIHIWSSKVDFSDPLSKTSKLEAGLKFSDVASNNDLVFGPFEDGAYQSDPKISDHFNYTEKINAAYINYENKFDKFDLVAGLRVEQTIAVGNSVSVGQVVNSNYVDPFPHLLLSYSPDDKHDFSLSYSRGIKRPAYEDINPFLYYVDPYDYRSGNPDLKPEYTNSVELSYQYNKSFLATLYTSIITNAYEFPFYEQNDTTKVNITTQKNLGDIYNYGIRIAAPVLFTHWWNAIFSVDASYQRYVAYPQNGNLDKGTQDILLGTSQNFIISPTITAVLSARYESPTFYGINQIKANYQVDGAIGKQLFNKRGSIKLNASDIFNTLRDRSYTNYQNLNMIIVDKKESQVFRLVFSYRFGNTGVKAAATHNTGNQDEQDRTKSANGN